MKNTIWLRNILCAGALLSLTAHYSMANGYKILCVRSAKATAMGEAYITQADDPSAIALNPAGLARQRGSQLNLQGTLCNAYTEHTSPSGEKTDNKDTWQLVPAFYSTTDFGRENLTAGFGVSFPNGLSSEWPEDSFARYVTTYANLTVADISPALGWRVNEHVLIGGGIDYYYSEARMDNMIDYGMMMGAPGTADVKSKMKGDGSAWGFNLGAIYDVNARHSLALTYRHPYSIDYDGDIKTGDDKMDITARFDFPMSLVAGYAYKPTEKWKIEANLDWTYWKGIDDPEIDFDTPGMPSRTLEQDYGNTMAYKIGLEYQATDKLALRGGYIYNENATPNHSWRPSLPDTDMHFFTTGFGYAFQQVTIDGAFQLVYYRARTIDNNVDNNENVSSSSVDGTYRTIAPCFSLSATYHF
ncbi:MAG: hypothetical protein EOM20_11410 [Spartobacteria bacterium]|nr:hypothetical protein [Spartobacteria bacterium]